MEIMTLRRKEILLFQDPITKLGIKIFRKWPYLYERDLATEKNYLKTYANAEDSILILAKDNALIIGAAIGLPICDSIEQVRKVFYEKQVEDKKGYYFGDIILLEQYRKKRIGVKMMQSFEYAVSVLKSYTSIYLCEVVREESDPRKPTDYKSLDGFWHALGYEVMPNWHASIPWRDVGNEKATPHFMQFRKKTIQRSVSEPSLF